VQGVERWKNEKEKRNKMNVEKMMRKIR